MTEIIPTYVLRCSDDEILPRDICGYPEITFLGSSSGEGRIGDIEANEYFVSPDRKFITEAIIVGLYGSYSKTDIKFLYEGERYIANVDTLTGDIKSISTKYGETAELDLDTLDDIQRHMKAVFPLATVRSKETPELADCFRPVDRDTRDDDLDMER